MTERKVSSKVYPLLTMLAGSICFTAVGLVMGFMSSRINEGLMLILGVPMSSLLMLLMLRRLDKDKILSVIIWSLLGGIVGLLAGFMVGELLAWFIGLIIPFLRDLEQVRAQILPNIVALIVADAIYGSLAGHLLYGRQSIRFFIAVCGIASIPFGLLMSMPFNLGWLGFDQNILFMLISYGTTTGLSIGMYSLLKSS